MQNNVDVTKVGFGLSDCGYYGASPDGLVGEDGMAEFKCPAPHTHIEYLLSGKMDMDYYPQVQGQLLVFNRKWSDWNSYNPGLPFVTIRVERDNAYIAKMAIALDKFKKMFDDKLQILRERGLYAE